MHTRSNKASLVLPRLALLPFLRSARYSVPSTRIDVGYGLFRRIGLYGLESISGAYSYVWRYNTQVYITLKVLDISYNNLYYASDIFNTFLDSNPTNTPQFRRAVHRRSRIYLHAHITTR